MMFQPDLYSTSKFFFVPVVDLEAAERKCIRIGSDSGMMRRQRGGKAQALDNGLRFERLVAIWIGKMRDGPPELLLQRQFALPDLGVRPVAQASIMSRSGSM